MMYSKLLSFVRWLVWQPVIYLLVQGILVICGVSIIMSAMALRGSEGFYVAFSLYDSIISKE